MAPNSIAGSEMGDERRGNTRDDSKVQKPDLYYGDREKLEDWFHQIQMYFLFTPVAKEKKTLFATTFLRGRAQHWIKPYLHKFLEDGPVDGDTNGLFADLNTLKENMRLVFGVTNDKETAIRVIQHLRQKSSASEYAIKFQEYAVVTEWDNNALMTMFRRGLKENVKDELMRNGGIIETLDVLIRTAIDIDDKLYERAMEKKHSFNPRGTFGFNGGIKNNHSAGDPMDLSATQKGRKPGPKKQQNNRSGKKSITCYGCGKEGHMKRDCRSSGKVQRTQFNTIARTPKELNVMQHNASGKFMSWSDEPQCAPPAHDSRRLHEGAQCYDDNCLFHEPEKRQAMFHYMFSKTACQWKGCEIAHLGYTGVPIKLREFNMMIRPAKKVTQNTDQRINGWTTSTVPRQNTKRQELHDDYRSPNNPHHPRHFTTDWRQCIHKGCITHEAAKQAEKEDGIPPVCNHTHPDHGILNWTECASDDCEIHRDEKETSNRKIIAQHEEGKGWALNEDETQRIHAYVNDQARINNIRPGTPIPTIKKHEETSTLEEGEIVAEPEQVDNSTEAETQQMSTPEESEDDSTDDELDDEFDANHIQFAAEASKPVIKLIKLIARNHKVAFPVQNGKTYLHPFHFEVMLKRIRTEFWNHRLVPITYDAKTFVQEVPPIGSDFTPNGYIAPDGTFFNKSMRDCTTKVKHLYKEMHMAQTAATYLMTQDEFNNDYTRALSTIKHVQSSMADLSKWVPKDWEIHYKNALELHGYPPNTSKDHGYTPHGEQSEN